jgi:hypothetical protein
MLVLSDIRTFDIAEGRVGGDQTHVTEILQRSQIFVLLPLLQKDPKICWQGYCVTRLAHLFPVSGEGAAVISLEPATTEGQSAEGLVDMLEQFLC